VAHAIAALRVDNQKSHTQNGLDEGVGAMTKELVAVQVEEGKPPVWIELSRDEPTGYSLVSKDDDELEPKDAPKSMDEALDRIKPLVKVLFEKLSSVETKPKEIELTLGLKLSGKVGLFIAESSGEATLSVKLKWVT
jgi:hypothetical protein